MRVKDLAPPKRPRCQSKLVTKEAIAYRNGDDTCNNQARYKIDGKLVCGRHAGALAIQALSKEK